VNANDLRAWREVELTSFFAEGHGSLARVINALCRRHRARLAWGTPPRLGFDHPAIDSRWPARSVVQARRDARAIRRASVSGAAMTENAIASFLEKIVGGHGSLDQGDHAGNSSVSSPADVENLYARYGVSKTTKGRL
jgi:hypothetical protein